ncbi:MAG: carboxylesterase family protein, partial [Maribacter sp.]
MKKYILGLVVLLGVTISAQESAPKVKTELGVIRGVHKDGVASFKGIPFAAPPVGQFRWRAPQPLSHWEGELDATEYGANCAQSGWGGAPGTISEGSSEDCLYLNVWKP